jgi:hypothetical protein
MPVIRSLKDVVKRHQSLIVCLPDETKDVIQKMLSSEAFATNKNGFDVISSIETTISNIKSYTNYFNEIKGDNPIVVPLIQEMNKLGRFKSKELKKAIDNKNQVKFLYLLKTRNYKEAANWIINYKFEVNRHCYNEEAIKNLHSSGCPESFIILASILRSCNKLVRNFFSMNDVARDYLQSCWDIDIPMKISFAIDGFEAFIKVGKKYKNKSVQCYLHMLRDRVAEIYKGKSPDGFSVCSFLSSKDSNSYTYREYNILAYAYVLSERRTVGMSSSPSIQTLSGIFNNILLAGKLGDIKISINEYFLEAIPALTTKHVYKEDSGAYSVSLAMRQADKKGHCSEIVPASRQ